MDELMTKNWITHDWTTDRELPECKACGESAISLGFYGDEQWQTSHVGWRTPCTKATMYTEQAIEEYFDYCLQQIPDDESNRTELQGDLAKCVVMSRQLLATVRTSRERSR